MKVMPGLGGPRCPKCYVSVGGEHEPGCSEAAMQEAAKHRPADFVNRSAEEQWMIDKSLGILDWEGF